MRCVISLVAVAALAVGAPVAAQAADFTFVPVADALVRSDNPTSKYGTRIEIRARSGAPEIRSYLRFDVQGVGPAVGATLRLFVTDPSASGGSIGTVADTTWVESAIAYDTAPPISAPFATSGGAVGGTWVEFDVGSVVTGDGTYNFGLTTAVTDSVIYSSREGLNPPELILHTGGPSPPRAEFSSNPLSGTAPLNVDFTDLSSGGPTTWLWEFGDGGASPEPSPSHTYDVPGTYTVTLTVSNFIGSDTETKTNLVVVREPSAGGSVRVLAAGDIACDPASSSFKAGLGTATRCRQKYTADLVTAAAPDAAIVLGDLQYEAGTLSNFMASY
ncbi:MAG TPA: PKD domain-containing protein, partial [Gaiellaceae bacterium]|nr:PKD domain-containing protein [Gaiellaceae bacterium]